MLNCLQPADSAALGSEVRMQGLESRDVLGWKRYFPCIANLPHSCASNFFLKGTGSGAFIGVWELDPLAATGKSRRLQEQPLGEDKEHSVQSDNKYIHQFWGNPIYEHAHGSHGILVGHTHLL